MANSQFSLVLLRYLLVSGAAQSQRGNYSANGSLKWQLYDISVAHSFYCQIEVTQAREKHSALKANKSTATLERCWHTLHTLIWFTEKTKQENKEKENYF